MADIAGLYSQYLGRAPDAAGLEYWNNQINSGAMTEAQVRSNIVGSNEYKDVAAKDKSAFIYGDHDNNPLTAPTLTNNANIAPDLKAAITKLQVNQVATPAQSAASTLKSAYTGNYNTPYTNVGANRRDDSVANGVTKLMAQDSPLMQQARTKGLQSANARGLLNSSMAVNAAEDAAYTAALPIASQDASQAMQTNLADANRELNLTTQANQLGVSEAQNIRGIDNQATQAALDRSIQADIAKSNASAAAKQLLLTHAANLESVRSSKIANINANTNLDAATRQTQIDAAQKEFDNAFTFAKNLASVQVNY